MKFLKATLLTISICFSIQLRAQYQIDSLFQAKEYFREAQKQFDEDNFKNVLYYFLETKKNLSILQNKDTTTGILLNLKIKTLYELKRYKEAKEEYDIFKKDHMQSASVKLQKETFSYYVKIEQKIKEIKEINDREERENKFKEWMRNTIENIEYIDCYNCDGKGKYSLTVEKYGRSSWFRKNKFRTCEIFEGEEKLLDFEKLKYNGNNIELIDLTTYQFFDLYKEETKKRLNKLNDDAWKEKTFYRFTYRFHKGKELKFKDRKEGLNYTGNNPLFKELTIKGFETLFREEIKEHLVNYKSKRKKRPESQEKTE
jgi:hypothetical protein